MERDHRIGTVLCGKWTLERVLGSGGMATVYVGVHKIGRRDAIKILHTQIAREGELRARFDQEAYAVNRFVHPGAVEIRDIDLTEDGCPFLVMELLEGDSLRARCERAGSPDIAEILRIADDVLDVLAAAHAQGIIHRDIKPDNLFCVLDGRIKVLDFGVARVCQATNAFRTRTGTTLGTVAYMPPEQVNALDIDGRADVFAVGATMFRLIAKRRIHEARSDSELLVKMATQPAPPLSSVAPEAPASVCAIVDRALVFAREGRYPNARVMQQDIRALRTGQPPAFALAGAAGTPTRQVGRVDRDAATSAANPGKPSAAASPTPTRWTGAEAPLALLGQQGSVIAPVPIPRPTELTALTQWTLTTLRERRLRWAAVLPLIAAGVLALVFYRVTLVGPAQTGAEQRSAKATKPSSASPEARVPASAPAAEAERRGSVEPPDLDCLRGSTCEQVCNHKCKLACTNRNGCSIGAAHGAMVHCRGPGPCVVSCAGRCKIKSQRGAPLLVHCAPGFECEIEDCREQVKRCSPSLFACGTPCPD